MTEKRYKTLLKILSSINIEFTIKGTEPNPKENSFFIVLNHSIKISYSEIPEFVEYISNDKSSKEEKLNKALVSCLQITDWINDLAEKFDAGKLVVQDGVIKEI